MTTPLAPKRFVRTSFGRIAYLETGAADAPPVLFVHGIPTSSYLWRDVIRLLQNDFHCLAPDLMGLGDTEVDPDDTQFHMEAQAQMLEEFMRELGHERYSVVCHDQGGAAAQLLVTTIPDQISCFVITDAVCYDNWPVPVIAQLQTLSRLPVIAKALTRRGITAWLETKTPFSRFRTGVYDPARFSDETIREYVRPMVESDVGYERFKRFLLAGHPRYTLKAAEALKRFERPTTIVWACDDHYLSPSWAQRLYEDIPGAKSLELVPFCGHFWQEEKPAEFSAKIGRFIAAQLAQERADTSAEASKELKTPEIESRKLPAA